MHILLTGATGFIGRNLLDGLLDAGHRVTAVVRPDSPHKDVLPPESERLHFVYGLFYDSTFLETLKNHFDVIIHAAAIRGAGKGKYQKYVQVNVEGTRILTEFALKQNIPRFLYLSTVGVLGTIPKNLPAKADDPPAPDGPYHRSKWEAEKLIKEIPRHKLNSLILRPTITYGSYDNGFLPRLIHFIRAKRLMLPRETVTIHLLFVQSLVRLINQILALDFFYHQTYLIADAQPVPLQQLADLIAREVGGGYRRLSPFYFKTGESIFALLGRSDLKTSLQLLSHSWYYDITPIKKDLFYEPVETLDKMPEIIKTLVRQGVK